MTLNRVTGYVTAVVLGAVVAVVGVYLRQPSAGDIGAIALLSGLALMAELLAFLLPLTARGSISFIPYLAIVLIAPSWAAVVAVSVVKAISEAALRNENIKAVFNIGQHALILSIAILVYLSMGGQSLQLVSTAGLLAATVSMGLPAFVSFISAYAANITLVSVVISLSTGVSVEQVWRRNSLATVGIDILSAPLIFVFAWVYAAFGAIAAATLWVPILGLRQLHKTNLELERTNEELLELMVKSLEARDRYTSGHSRRVQHYSTLIARAIGLPEREVSLVSRAALLHDVGKLDEKYGPILSKADQLTPAEWVIIQQHPVDGANLVSTMSRLRELVGPIRHHHENWDGTGYPDGLAGELIPLSSRIIRFADTIDAMTTERPYRRPLSEPEVRAELVRCRGKQFDPTLTDRLLSSASWKQLFQTSQLVADPKPTLRILGEKPSLTA